MSPESFIQRPIRWLQVISRYQGTHSGAPNFAYELCTQKSEQIFNVDIDIDLRSWCVAVNGAEPIRQQTLEKFTQTFEPFGFRRRTFCPGYGLAEATLKVCSVRKTDSPVICTVQGSALEQNRLVKAYEDQKDTRMLVGCGSASLDTKIVIVNPESLTQCFPNQVGEIWVSGASVAQGYWNRPEETEKTFRAQLRDRGVSEAERSPVPFLRTGDLGFLQDGELFVTGRLKDVLIIRGRNHYPQDIESTVEQSHFSLRSCYSAAFSVDVAGEERLVVVAEVKRESLGQLDRDAVVISICQAVAEQHELEVHAILLVKTASIAKTSSGKIQRRACRTSFLTGSLDVIHQWSTIPQSAVEIQRLMAEIESLERQVRSSKQQRSFLDKNYTLKQTSYNNESWQAETIQAWLVSKIAQWRKVQPEEISIQEPFADSLDSLAVVSLSGELGVWLKRKLSPDLVYEYTTIKALAQHLAQQSNTSDNNRFIPNGVSRI